MQEVGFHVDPGPPVHWKQPHHDCMTDIELPFKGSALTCQWVSLYGWVLLKHQWPSTEKFHRYRWPAGIKPLTLWSTHTGLSCCTISHPMGTLTWDCMHVGIIIIFYSWELTGTHWQHPQCYSSVGNQSQTWSFSICHLHFLCACMCICNCWNVVVYTTIMQQCTC